MRLALFLLLFLFSFSFAGLFGLVTVEECDKKVQEDISKGTFTVDYAQCLHQAALSYAYNCPGYDPSPNPNDPNQAAPCKQEHDTAVATCEAIYSPPERGTDIYLNRANLCFGDIAKIYFRDSGICGKISDYGAEKGSLSFGSKISREICKKQQEKLLESANPKDCGVIKFIVLFGGFLFLIQRKNKTRVH